MPSGTIKLWSGQYKITEARYYSVKSRASVIESWRILHGAKMEKYDIGILPDYEPTYHLQKENILKYPAKKK